MQEVTKKIFGFSVLMGFGVSKLTAFEEFSNFGFNFFNKTDGFDGSAHMFSSLIVYTLVFLITFYFLYFVFKMLTTKKSKYDVKKGRSIFFYLKVKLFSLLKWIITPPSSNIEKFLLLFLILILFLFNLILLPVIF